MQLTIGEAQRMAIRESVALGKEVATELARRAAANKPEHMLTQKATPVLESLNMRVMAWALKEQPLLREAGVVLDGYPATRQQANSLRVQVCLQHPKPARCRKEARALTLRGGRVWSYRGSWWSRRATRLCWRPRGAGGSTSQAGACTTWTGGSDFRSPLREI
jgi:hypothetical protein